MLLVRRFYAMLDGTNIQPRKRVRPTFVKYDPARQSMAFNSGAAGRTIRQSEMPFDPLAQHKRRFRRRLPRPSRSRPVPARRDQDDWKVPPCVYNRKNPDKAPTGVVGWRGDAGRSDRPQLRRARRGAGRRGEGGQGGLPDTEQTGQGVLRRSTWTGSGRQEGEAGGVRVR